MAPQDLPISAGLSHPAARHHRRQRGPAGRGRGPRLATQRAARGGETNGHVATGGG